MSYRVGLGCRLVCVPAAAGGRRGHASVLRGQAGGRRVRGREGGPGRVSVAVGLRAPGRKIPSTVSEGRKLQSFAILIF